MNQTIADPFEEVIRRSGQGWLIDWHAPKDQAIPNLRRMLSDANESGRLRLGDNAPELTPEAVVREYSLNPHKVHAFLQVVGSVRTPHILLMVWRILQGMNIAEIRMNYESERVYSMSVRLGQDEVYESNDIDDAVVFRHLGIMKMGDAPLFDGFYPLNVK